MREQAHILMHVGCAAATCSSQGVRLALGPCGALLPAIAPFAKGVSTAACNIVSIAVKAQGSAIPLKCALKSPFCELCLFCQCLTVLSMCGWGGLVSQAQEPGLPKIMLSKC
jgi:hypothetical protein